MVFSFQINILNLQILSIIWRCSVISSNRKAICMCNTVCPSMINILLKVHLLRTNFHDSKSKGPKLRLNNKKSKMLYKVLVNYYIIRKLNLER